MARDVRAEDGSYAQDMVLHLNVPQMNSLRYLIGRDLRSFIRTEEFNAQVPEEAKYDGEMPYLIIRTGWTENLDEPLQDAALRSATQREYDFVANLQEQLDELWRRA